MHRERHNIFNMLNEEFLLSSEFLFLFDSDCCSRENNTLEIIRVSDHISTFILNVEEAISMHVFKLNFTIRQHIVFLRIRRVPRRCTCFDFTEESLHCECLITFIMFLLSKHSTIFFFLFIIAFILNFVSLIGIFCPLELPLENTLFLSTS